ncbi:PREDICTED: QWRF motif-containing protein 2-like [Nicotiana attenuata]|uniref:Qwrf motif-containing protein 2 n=1 Tax=Nicotiana attenuata TaxID=49451 RepID=A0A1J6HWT5_NICAT|nr:PREDICTED: QWRF motif-containing protein 2-like [Nicotiana attenuata]OIS96841.1 qwrf motif-containing protein 2 [Nicotiana attenuata]
MVTAVSMSCQNPKRPPLLRSEAENAPQRRPKSREVTSRYLSTSSSSSISTTSSSNTSSYSSSSESIASRRSQSPMVTRTVATPVQNSGLIKRSQSMDRRRPTTPVTREMSTAAKMLLTSTRSLSISFQGESVSFPVSKKKPAPTRYNLSSARRGTPERRKAGPELVTLAKDRAENSFLSDQQRWPGRLKPVNSSFLTRSLDCGNEIRKFGSRSVLRSLSKSVIDDNHGVKIEAKLKPQYGNVVKLNVNSDSESVSSGSTSGVYEGGNVAQGRGSSRGIVVPARFWQETSSRIRCGAEPGSPVSKNSGLKTAVPSKQMFNRRNLIDSPTPSPWGMPASRGFVSPLRGGGRPASPGTAVELSSNSLSRGMQSPTRTRNGVTGTPASRGFVSPLRVGARRASPGKAVALSSNSLSRGMQSPTRSRNGVRDTPSTNSLSSSTQSPTGIRNGVMATPSTNSLSRGMPSPTRIRNGVMDTIPNNACIMPSSLSFSADARRGKAGENRIIDAHELRLLNNRQIQWRFANARAEAALMAQTETSERNLYNAWLATSKLRHSVMSKRIQLQLLQQNVKLYSILKGQVPSLENWDLTDGDHSNSMSGAICALEASTIRLPVVAGAVADVQNVKDAISSAVDVMQAMASSICSSLSKVEQVDLLVHELQNVAGNERALLDQCRDLLSSLTAVQVKDFSLRTHLLQMKRMVSCSSTEVKDD